jgi:glycosyltransferase involved in cell wall biosynthesis
MKVLVVVARDSAHPSAAGGDRHMTQLASQLAEGGDSVTLLTAGDPTLPSRERRGTLEIVRVGHPRLMFPIIWALELTSLHGRFDVVVEEAMGGERAPFLGRFLSGSPTVGFWYQDNRGLISLLYGTIASSIGGWVQQLLLRAGREGFALGNSQTTTDWLVAHGFERDRVTESFPSVERSAAPTTIRSFRDRRNMIVSIGNFRATKRFEEAVAVFQQVRREVPDAELAIVGRAQDPNYLARLRSLVSANGLESTVHFYVGVSEAEKFELLSQAKVLTVHSPIEGFGWTVLEAGLCGVPTVGNVGISADALREGENGRRIAFGDVRGYSTAVARLLRDEGHWGSLSRGARAVAVGFTSGADEPRVRDVLARAAAGGHDAKGNVRS